MRFYETNIALVGATGLVGSTILRILEERGHIPHSLRLFASDRSIGERISFCGKTFSIEGLNGCDFSGTDLAIFCAGGNISREWAPSFASAGAIVIDKSSAWRTDPDCPLVIPEINPEDLNKIPKKIVASPNCSTIGFALAVKPLIHIFGEPEHIFVATYQSVSGAGEKALETFNNQLNGSDTIAPFPKRIAGNLFAEIGKLEDSGFYDEETKLVSETRKILHNPALEIHPTAVRVPVEVGHSEAVTIVFKNNIEFNFAREALEKAPCIKLMDDNRSPTPLDVAGKDDVLVGRLRISQGSKKIVSFFLSFDNLRRGAGTNAVGIAEELLNRNILR